MASLSRSLLGLVMFASPCFAQAPTPAPELGKFDQAVGNWKGSGTFRPSADAPKVPWTSTGTVRRVLGGHFVEDDRRIDVGQPLPLVYRSLYLLDTHTRRWRSISFSNTGFGGVADVYWSADGTKLVGATTRVEDGVPVVERWVTTYAKDQSTFLIERSVDGGPFYTQVEGRFERGGEGFDAAREVGAVLAPVAAEMKVLEREIGQWKFRGKVSMIPGMQPMDIASTQKTRAFVGGHANLGVLRGDPVPGAPMTYEARIYATWDPAQKCYRNLAVDNFGLWALENGYASGPRKIVYTTALVVFGIPHANRSVIEWSADGDKATVHTDRAAADAPPDRSFEGSVERVRVESAADGAQD